MTDAVTGAQHTHLWQMNPSHDIAGFCVAYLIFIAQNLASISHIKGPVFILGACPVLLALAMLRGVHALAPFSLIADAANILGKLVTSQYRSTPSCFAYIYNVLFLHKEMPCSGHKCIQLQCSYGQVAHT